MLIMTINTLLKATYSQHPSPKPPIQSTFIFSTAAFFYISIGMIIIRVIRIMRLQPPSLQPLSPTQSTLKSSTDAFLYTYKDGNDKADKGDKDNGGFLRHLLRRRR